MKDRSAHWSEDHQRLLFWAANRANCRLRALGFPPVELWDLAIAGWYRCARRCRDGRSLRVIKTNLVNAMVDYGLGFIKSRLRDKRAGAIFHRQFDEPSQRLDAADAIDFIRPRLTDCRSFDMAVHILGQDLTCKEAGRKMGLSYESARQLKNRFLAEARELMGAITKDQEGQGQP